MDSRSLAQRPELPAPIIMDQRWTDAVFLHWRIPDAVAAPFMPPGVVPDNFDGSAWVGLIGFRMQGAGLGRGPGIPYFGSFNEINVRLYSREPDGTRGVVFLSLDASRLAVVLAARAAGIPYVWSRAGFRGAGLLGSVAGRDGSRSGGRVPSAGYWVRRFRGGARTDFAVAPGARRRSNRSAVPPPHRPVRSAHPVPGPDPVCSQHPQRVAAVPGATDSLVRISWLPRPASTSRDRPNLCSSPPGCAPSLAGPGPEIAARSRLADPVLADRNGRWRTDRGAGGPERALAA